jgi:LmbE family N-acetylglucosaminyl deacetylase
MKFDRILLVSAHPDDSEIGAGGTVARLKRENPECKIWYVFFAPCLEDPLNTKIIDEHKMACNLLQIENSIEYNMPRDGYLETHKQEIRDILWKLKEDFKPDLVFCPSSNDLHQDHRAVAECCLTIFQRSSIILGYEVMSVSSDFKPTLYITLEDTDVTIKLIVLGCFNSQKKRTPILFACQSLVSPLRMRGNQVKAKWAEAFEFMRGCI